QMFEEVRFDIYSCHKLIEVKKPSKTETEKATESHCLVVNELIERIYNIYWQVEERGNSLQKNMFFQELSTYLESILNKN
ncbi:31529_t:CDS:1, partial [Gigaspora margarita]